MPPLLIDLAFSAWSEKARWALDWKGVPYARREFVPMIDDGWLRRAAGTDEVPALIPEGGGPALVGSTAIAMHAESASPTRPLLPSDRRLRAEALRWQDWAGDTLSPLGRSVITGGLIADRQAALATVPPSAPGYARLFAGVAVPIGLRAFRKAYGLDDATIAAARADLPRHLEIIDAALSDGRAYLVGDAFTLADIAVASALVLVAPAADAYFPRPMPAALRKAFTTPEALERFPAVFRWRDALYEKHRRPPAGAAAPAT